MRSESTEFSIFPQRRISQHQIALPHTPTFFPDAADFPVGNRFTYTGDFRECRSCDVD
jgi:hypothetical protein